MISDQTSTCGITVCSSELKSVICVGSWVDDSAISAFISVVDGRETVTFDPLIITKVKHAIYHGSIQSAAQFLSHHYSSYGPNVLVHQLRQCKSVQIPWFKGDGTGNGNH